MTRVKSNLGKFRLSTYQFAQHVFFMRNNTNKWCPSRGITPKNGSDTCIHLLRAQNNMR